MKKEILIISTPRGGNHFYELFKKAQKEPAFLGVDWGKDCGMNRGDIISREGNIIFVRFRTASIQDGGDSA